jgi:phosphoribosylformylglycinamidine cyclo-ligase
MESSRMNRRADDAYAAAGVDYEPLDRFKRFCQQAALATRGQLAAHGIREPESIRGESAYLLETEEEYLAHVEEGLGTKNIVADAMIGEMGERAYFNIGIDVVAAIVNDLITVGALPISVAMHAGVGDAGWFELGGRGEQLAAGFARGCELSGAVWGGGESPVLQGVIHKETAVLAGSAMGRIRPKQHRIMGNVRHGDAIVLLESSGIHANGITLCRAIAARMPQGFHTKMSDGRTFGEALLEPTVIYVSFIHECQKAGIIPHYAVNVTGHGWRKLMRLAEPFVYRITKLPPSSALFEFLCQEGGLSLSEGLATFNMGAGFGVYVAPEQVDQCLAIATRLGLKGWHAGTIEKQGDRKAVDFVEQGFSFDGESLKVRN